MSPEQLVDVMDCGRPDDARTMMIKQMEDRARAEEEIALSLEQDAKDAMQRADEHHKAAQEFQLIACALRE